MRDSTMAWNLEPTDSWIGRPVCVADQAILIVRRDGALCIQAFRRAAAPHHPVCLRAPGSKAPGGGLKGGGAGGIMASAERTGEQQPRQALAGPSGPVTCCGFPALRSNAGSKDRRAGTAGRLAASDRGWCPCVLHRRRPAASGQRCVHERWATCDPRLPDSDADRVAGRAGQRSLVAEGVHSGTGG